MAAVGFDLYNQLLQEAVKELRGEKVPEKKAAAPLFDLRVDSYLPDDYIRDGREKVEIYRRLALVESLEEVKELAAELRDRFGRMPDQVVYLFDLALIRVRAAQLGIKDVQHNRHTMAIRFDNEAQHCMVSSLLPGAAFSGNASAFLQLQGWRSV